MPLSRCLLPSEIKGVNEGARKSLPRSAKRPLFAHLRAGRDAILNRLAPIGYEDETGFHYAESRPKRG